MKNQIGKFLIQLSMLSICLLFGVSSMSFPNGSAFSTQFENCPTASFSISNNGCTVSCEVSFINESINATSYHWDFGDGDSSTLKNPGHVYQTPGEYTVTLTAIIDGCQHSIIGTVEVIAG